MGSVILIGIGGMAGAVLRYGMVTSVQRLTGGSMPWGTLFVNVVGSFALGFMLLASDRMGWPEAVRRFAAIGVLGAFTTFSAFSWEVVGMLREGQWVRGATYAGGSVVLSVLAVVAGSVAASSTLS